jgi:hypothetical protein
MWLRDDMWLRNEAGCVGVWVPACADMANVIVFAGGYGGRRRGTLRGEGMAKNRDLLGRPVDNDFDSCDV